MRKMGGPTSRRRVLGLGGLGVAGAILAGCSEQSAPAPTAATSAAGGPAWLMPDEGEPHTRTWMAFGATEAIWTADLIDEVRQNLADTALAIAEHEPVSMLVRPAEMSIARDLMGSEVDLIEGRLDDLWMRDTGPVFVGAQGAKAGIDFNFNGWGRRQKHDLDATVVEQVAGRSDIELLRTELVLEGGALEVDGVGNAIITESCVLNDNRNPGWTKAQVEAELGRLLGIRKVIWLPGIRGRDITDGHTDFYARFASPGVVVAGLDNDPESYDHAVTRRHLELLREATTVDGQPLDVVTIAGPDEIRPDFATDEFAAGYINFYVCNDAVIAPEFGDSAADANAKEALQELFPDRAVVQVAIDGIAAGGGGIHCATQQQPA